MENRKLKACPFCGRKDNLRIDTYDEDSRSWWYVSDVECMVNGPMAASEEDAIELWNKRAE